MAKVHFSDNDSAHDFAQRIGANVDCESDSNGGHYSVNTDNASNSKDNPYNSDPDHPDNH